MANYTNNKKATELDVLTSLASDDVIVFGDTSDSGKAKAITTTNLKTAMESGLVKATITDTTPDYLDSKISFTSVDSSVTITKTVTNAGMDEVITYDLAAIGGGSGGGGGMSKLTQTFAFGDFSGTTHAAFTGTLPANAVPIGVVYDVVSAFDSGLSLDVINSIAGGISISPPVDADTTGTRVGLSDSVALDFTATPNPVLRASGIPTQGSVIVSIVYDDSAPEEKIMTYISTPVALTAGGTSTPTSLSSNTSMAVGMINIPQKITFTKLTVYIASSASSGTFDFAIYSEDCQTLLLTATSGTISSGGAVNTTTVSSTTLPAGNYYVGVHANGSASLGLRSIVLDNLNVTPTGGSILAGIVPIDPSTTPATFSPSDDIAFNLYAIPLVRFDA